MARWTAPKPFVAAVQGYAVGAGCELALSCDLIVAEEGARFGFPEVTVGLTITNGGTYFLPRLVGLARAKELAFLGDLVDAEACRQMGLVNRVVPAGGARAVALEMAQTIARRAPLSVQFHKAAINRAAGADLERPWPSRPSWPFSASSRRTTGRARGLSWRSAKRDSSGASALTQKFAEYFPFALSLSKGEILRRSCFDRLRRELSRTAQHER